MNGVLTSKSALERMVLAGLAAVILFLWWNMVRRAMAGPGSQYDDFVGFARDLLFLHQNLYETYPAWNTIVKYPPFFGFVYAPLVPLPAWLGASIWFWTSLACSAGAAAASALAVGASAEELRRRPSLGWMPYLLIGGVVISNLETAQVNLFVLFFVTLGLLALERWSEAAAGGLVGYAAAIKLMPVIFVPYFAWVRRWRSAAMAVATIAICWSILMWGGLGFDMGLWTDVTRDWLAAVSPFVSEGGVAEGEGGFRHTNQSLAAAVHRYLTKTPADGRDFYVNVAALTPKSAQGIVLALSGAVLIGLMWLTGPLARARLLDGMAMIGSPAEGALRRGFAYSLVMIATLFLSPVSWINHYVLLLFPFAAAWRYVATRPADDPGRRILVACLVASFALVATGISQFLMAFSLPFVGAAVLFTGMAIVLRRDLAVGVASRRVQTGA
ncbi:MAG: glycosyltransferase family 87 protein [Gemmatimonadota bacterium]